MAKKADVVARLVAVKSGGSAAGSVGTGFAEHGNAAFALSKGALTVGELAAATTQPKSAAPALMQSRNSASCGGWGTFGAASAQDPVPPQPLRVKAESAPPSNDPFGFGAASEVAKTAATQQEDLTWGAFQ
ncbi:unnamed protein product [Phytophthora fragariaefolia]|uniref:Unnamed protein product n=1 Tax=Phytophthora fragariaefolia TaxID=1490495 RepID=A0A9W7CNU4_9STRA|nr:unnamed protein product [Phytophthora fragariaefolia]